MVITSVADVFQATNEGENRQYRLDDFELLRVIGRGSYAKVLMVELKKTKRIYAMKVIKKELVNDDEVAILNMQLHIITLDIHEILRISRRISSDGLRFHTILSP